MKNITLTYSNGDKEKTKLDSLDDEKVLKETAQLEFNTVWTLKDSCGNYKRILNMKFVRQIEIQGECEDIGID